MKKVEIEKYKEWFKPILDAGRKMFGAEVYDNHVKDVLLYFGFDLNDIAIKEIFEIK